VRLPVRVTGIISTLQRLCLTTARDMAFPVEPDCIENIPVPFIDLSDAANLTPAEVPLATVESRGTVNVRSGHGIDVSIVTGIQNGQVVTTVGRNETGDWVKIQALRYDGSMNTSLLCLNTSVELLPIFS